MKENLDKPTNILKPDNIFKNEVLPDIIARRDNILAGNINAIPFNFSKLSSYVYGVEKSRQYGITAASGGSKSKLGRDMFLFQPFDFYHKNKDKMDIDVRINMFCLEDNKKKVGYNLISKALWDVYKIRIPIKVLESQNADNPLPYDVLQKIEKLEPYFEDFHSKLYLSNTANPTGIKKEIEKFLTNPAIGFYTTSLGKKLNNTQKQYDGYEIDKSGNKVYKQYTELQQYIRQGGQVKFEYVNKNLFVINIIDNLQNILQEKGDSKYTTLDSFCRNLMRARLCEFFGCSNVLIQQQNQAMRQLKTDITGDAIVDHYIPSLSGLGEFKNSVQTMHYIFGIYSPFNDRVKKFMKYDITKIGYFYRHIYILKSNYMANVDFPVFADPIAETFMDLPSYDDTTGLNKIYQEIINLASKEYKL